MPDVKKILYPLELSSISPKVAPWVVTMAEHFKAELHVVHVVPVLEFWGVAYASEALEEQDRDALVKRAQKHVEEFCYEHFKDYKPAVTKALWGEPVREILGYVENEGMDMIVMGNHGKKGLDHALFGSVAEKVLNNSPVPVLTVRKKAWAEK
ncbi:MAG: universal stress protein [Deltaproteobacteria bacterium]|nr:universal stress protein [Deltaproteobacteria bacterium]